MSMKLQRDTWHTWQHSYVDWISAAGGSISLILQVWTNMTSICWLIESLAFY